jgi:hypothetical protein
MSLRASRCLWTNHAFILLCIVIFNLCVLTTLSDVLTLSLYVLVVSFKEIVMMGRTCVGSHECCF